MAPHVGAMSVAKSPNDTTRETGDVMDRVWSYGTTEIGGLLLGLLLARGIGAAVGGSVAAIVCVIDARRRSSHP